MRKKSCNIKVCSFNLTDLIPVRGRGLISELMTWFPDNTDRTVIHIYRCLVQVLLSGCFLASSSCSSSQVSLDSVHLDMCRWMLNEVKLILLFFCMSVACVWKNYDVYLDLHKKHPIMNVCLFVYILTPDFLVLFYGLNINMVNCITHYNVL